MKVISLNVNPNGGVPKHSIDTITVENDAVLEDKQAWVTEEGGNHGTPLRAVTLFSSERIAELQQAGHPIDIGTTGENITTQGMDWDTLKEGMAVSIGSTVLELTFIAPPCNKISSSFTGRDFRIMREGGRYGRWCARVIKEGKINIGDSIVFLNTK